MKKKAIYAGTFDPFTLGHQDILNKSLEVFDEVILLVAKSSAKHCLFSSDERVQILKKLFQKDSRVQVASYEGLVVEFAKLKKIKTLIRGLRPTGDFEMEFQMAAMNKKISNNIETVFFMTGENFYYVSSSLIKEVYKNGGDISSFIPKLVYQALKKVKGRL
ncbi:MAG: pantetheine-phosphate adenylyltransferase [Bacteriovoracaceae bacterium]|nr:pantetheine-phosphate adenylyltransferase [Bacteriovoracaceae bacterium]